MPFDASTATPVEAAPEFDPSSAEPVAVGDGEKKDPFALDEAKFTAASPLERLKMMVEHPWDKYVASVDQGFTGPIKPTHIEGESVPGQIAAAGVNVAQGVGTSVVTPGAAAAIVSPATILYSIPRFAVGGVEDIYDAVKGAIGGTANTQETLEKSASGILQLAGAKLGGEHGLDSVRPPAPKTPLEAIDIIKAQAEKTEDPKAKAALEGAAQKIADKANEGVAFDPTTATPIEELPGAAQMIVEKAESLGLKATVTDSAATFDEATAEPVANTQGTTDFSGAEPSGDTFGIAARVSDARAAGGHIAPVEPGQGTTPEATIAKGREALAAGADPQAAIDEFTQTGRISADQVSLARAHGERLAKAASEAADKFGIESPEYKAAADADTAWIQAIKPLQTEWHKIGQAQQGETDIDTGSYHGIRRAFQEASGRDLTPDQSEKAQGIASSVKAADAEVTAAKAKVLDELAKAEPADAPKKGLGLSAAIKEAAQAARQRIRDRLGSGKVSSGLDPLDVADHAIVGAEYIAKGIDTFADWSKAMLNEFGERIRPHLEEIFARSKESVKEPATPADVWTLAKNYLAAGESDFDDIRHKIATDTGMSVEEVTKVLAEPKSLRVLTDEMYAKQAARRQLVSAAKNWINDQVAPGWLRAMRALPRAFFKLATFGHGTVGMVTHAGLNVFDPVVQRPYWTNFFRQFKLLGLHDQGAYHERMMQDLVRDPNYITARRAGLANDPAHYSDDYQRGWLTGHLQRIGLIGNRGFDALKLYRQDRFNQIWDGLPDSLRTRDMAKLLADGINHSTGVVKTRFPEWSNWAFFAPKLEGSRWAWMISDPLKAANTIANWKNATPAQKAFALSQVRQKATITGVYLTLLATNQALLLAAGSKQQVNVTDPSRSDFLAFKAADHNFGIVSPLLGVVRLMANLLHAGIGTRTKAEQSKGRAEQMYETAGEYVRGKASPFAGVAADVATQSDFMRRPLPFSSDKVPKYLRREGTEKYTVGEYALEHLMPIPVEEAVREVWRKQGMAESDIHHWMMALGSAAMMGTTGARMSPDTHVGQPPRR